MKSMEKTQILFPCVGAAFLSLACGGSSVTPEHGGELPSVDEAISADAEIAIEGLRGTVDQDDVNRVFQRRMGMLLSCYGDVVEDDLEEIEGHLELSLRIDTAGGADQVFPIASDVGSSTVEYCIVSKVESFNFPKAIGGYAEVNYSLDLEAPYEHPPFKRISPSEIDSVRESNSEDVEACLSGHGDIKITLYAGGRGRVLSAGVSYATYDCAEAAQCLLEKVMGWKFPDQGRDLAKVELSF